MFNKFSSGSLALLQKHRFFRPPFRPLRPPDIRHYRIPNSIFPLKKQNKTNKQTNKNHLPLNNYLLPGHPSSSCTSRRWPLNLYYTSILHSTPISCIYQDISHIETHYFTTFSNVIVNIISINSSLQIPK